MSKDTKDTGRALVAAGPSKSAIVPAAAPSDGGELPAAEARRVEVAQEANSVGGNMSGRDVNVPSGDMHIYNEPVHQHFHEERCPSHLAKLYRRLAAEAKGDANLTTYIAQLEVFTRSVDSDQVIGLENKLILAGRSDRVTLVH